MLINLESKSFLLWEIQRKTYFMVWPVSGRLKTGIIKQLSSIAIATYPMTHAMFVHFCKLRNYNLRRRQNWNLVTNRGLDYVFDAGYEITAHTLSSQRCVESSSYHLGFTVKICKSSIVMSQKNPFFRSGKRKRRNSSTTFPTERKAALAESDRGSYYNQEERCDQRS